MAGEQEFRGDSLLLETISSSEKGKNRVERRKRRLYCSKKIGRNGLLMAGSLTRGEREKDVMQAGLMRH